MPKETQKPEAQKSTWIAFIFAAYLGGVCLISGLTTTFSLAAIANDSIVYNFPELEVRWYEIERPIYNKRLKRDIPATEAQQEERLSKELDRVKLQSLRNILDASTHLIIGLLIFLFHWRLFKKERNS